MFLKDIAQNMKTERTYLENKWETNTNFVDNPEYTKTNEKLDKIYLEKTNSIRIRSECHLYENGEIFFFNLGKSRAVQNKFGTS